MIPMSNFRIFIPSLKYYKRKIRLVELSFIFLSPNFISFGP